MRKTAKPMMSTYSFEVPAVAMSSMIGISRVTFWPAEFVPVARTVSGYSPGPSGPAVDRQVDRLGVALVEGERARASR